MEFVIIVMVLAVISVAWAYFSIRRDVRKTGEEKQVKEDLAKGRVIFYSSSKDSVS